MNGHPPSSTDNDVGPTHEAALQQIIAGIYLSFFHSFFFYSSPQRFLFRVRSGFWARLQKWTFSEWKEEEEEEKGRKEEKNAACLLGALFAIPFPMHLVCVCAERERGSEGGWPSGAD